MKTNIDSILNEYKKIQEQLVDPSVVSDHTLYINLSKKIKKLSPIIEIHDNILKFEKQKKEAESLLKDPDMKLLAQEELHEAKAALLRLYEELKLALLPKDENDDKNIILEIRQAAGGDEASLFAAELGRAYLKFAENEGFKVEMISWQESETGGLKEGSCEIKGINVYELFKYESGVHRVQRIPSTESQGRIHTSTCTVAVMPQVEAVDVEIEEKDLRIDTYRAQGAGGQHVNTTDSAIRITHIPTGTVVTCQDGRSQHKNKEKALNVLRARLYQFALDSAQNESSSLRLSQVGTGDRSEKIRTYNYPQDRITDHRIKESWSNLPYILEGNFRPMIEKITIEDQSRKISLIENQ